MQRILFIIIFMGLSLQAMAETDIVRQYEDKKRTGEAVQSILKETIEMQSKYKFLTDEDIEKLTALISKIKYSKDFHVIVEFFELRAKAYNQMDIFLSRELMNTSNESEKKILRKLRENGQQDGKHINKIFSKSRDLEKSIVR